MTVIIPSNDRICELDDGEQGAGIQSVQCKGQKDRGQQDHYNEAHDAADDDADDRTLPLRDTSEAHRTAQVHRHVCLDLVVGIAAVSAYGKVDKTKVHVLKVLRAAGEHAIGWLPHVLVDIVLEGPFAHEMCGIPQWD